MGKCDLNLSVPQFPLIKGNRFSILHALFRVLISSKQITWFAFVCLFVSISKKKKRGHQTCSKYVHWCCSAHFRGGLCVIVGNLEFTAEQ